MKWFRFGQRKDVRQPIPAVQAPLAHLIGPGKLLVVNRRLCFATRDGKQLSLDPEGLESLLCYGDVSPTADALILMSRHGVRLSILALDGRKLLARLDPADNRQILLRLLQLRLFEDARQRHVLARDVVAQKIHSQLGAVRHYQRQGKDVPGETLLKLAELEAECERGHTLEELRGLEGASSALWFGVFRELLAKPWQFPSRVKHPPTDPVNALLSFGYTLLLSKTTTLLEASGLESTLGCLHSYRAGRPSLACDLMEPWRVPAVDRWVIQICNQRRISPDDFRQVEDAVLLAEASLPKVVADWEEYWNLRDFGALLRHQVAAFIRRLREGGESSKRLLQLLEDPDRRSPPGLSATA